MWTPASLVVYAVFVLFLAGIGFVLWATYLETHNLTTRTLLKGWLDGKLSIGRYVAGFIGFVLFCAAVLIAINVMTGTGS